MTPCSLSRAGATAALARAEGQGHGEWAAEVRARRGVCPKRCHHASALIAKRVFLVSISGSSHSNQGFLEGHFLVCWRVSFKVLDCEDCCQIWGLCEPDWKPDYTNTNLNFSPLHVVAFWSKPQSQACHCLWRRSAFKRWMCGTCCQLTLAAVVT